MQYQFFNDYSETAHPDCLAALSKDPLTQASGYGLDHITEQAIALLKSTLKTPTADIHFVSGGTQANLVTLSAILRPHEAVICAQTGHIFSNETGAIEATGHKVIALPAIAGKLTPSLIREHHAKFSNEHVVLPKVVFISQSTELGTVYTLAEMQSIKDTCTALGLYLYIDGARMGSALMSHETDWSLADIAALADVFYIGGTKNGALLGEAIVIVNSALQSHFRFHLKQRGALLAKGRVVASQFLALFSHGLFEQLALHANQCAMRLQAGLLDMGAQIDTLSSTNQVFVQLPEQTVNVLSKRYGFHTMGVSANGLKTIRLVTSWATPIDQIEQFLTDAKVALIGS